MTTKKESTKAKTEKPKAAKAKSATINSAKKISTVESAKQPQTDLSCEQQATILYRLRDLHNNTAKGKAKAHSWAPPFLIGGIAGICACIAMLFAMAFAVEANKDLNSTFSGSPIPGLIGLAALVATWILTTFFLRRKMKQESGILVSKAEAELKSALDEIAQLYPKWFVDVGGMASLSNSKNIEILVVKEGHDWDGCECKRCRKTREEGHDWNGCICRRCLKKRKEGHDWVGCACRRCGVKGNHIIVGCKCKTCGEEIHEWVFVDLVYHARDSEGTGDGYNVYRKYRCSRCSVQKVSA